MSVTSVLAILRAIFKAIPSIQDIWDRLLALYVQSQIDSFDAAIVDGIRQALADHDQRQLEKTIGSPRAGVPSGAPGAEQVDKLPGVP